MLTLKLMCEIVRCVCVGGGWRLWWNTYTSDGANCFHTFGIAYKREKRACNDWWAQISLCVREREMNKREEFWAVCQQSHLTTGHKSEVIWIRQSPTSMSPITERSMEMVNLKLLFCFMIYWYVEFHPLSASSCWLQGMYEPRLNMLSTTHTDTHTQPYSEYMSRWDILAEKPQTQFSLH